MDKLKSVTIVLPKADLVLSSIIGTYDLFLEANQETGAETEINIVGTSKTQTFFDDTFLLKTDGHFSTAKRADLIIVPAFKSDLSLALKENQALIKWLRHQYEAGAFLASLCSGAFLLAASGILDGKTCTCHYAQSDDFLSLFPETDFKKNEIITECKGIFTSGGAFSFLNLIIYLIEKFYSTAIAHQLYRSYQIDYHRKTQAAFAIFESKKSHGDAAIIAAQEFIETHYAEPLTIAQIAKKANLSARTLSRRFKELTHHTVNQYLQKIRIETAKSLLVETQKNISEIQFEVGFNDSKSFRSIFMKLTRTTPSGYRRQFQIPNP